MTKIVFHYSLAIKVYKCTDQSYILAQLSE